MQSINISDTDQAHCLPAICHTCSHQESCLCYSTVKIGCQPSQLISLERKLKKGQQVFSVDDPFSSITIVKYGCIKTYLITEDGEELVTGFHFPGDVVGYDGIPRGMHSNYCKSVDTALICKVNFCDLEKVAVSNYALKSKLFAILGSKIREEQALILLLCKKSSLQKIVWFLIYLERRLRLNEYQLKSFSLPMSRSDIASYLGMAIETVSRSFTILAAQGLISVHGKSITINDLEELSRLVDDEVMEV